MRFHRIRFALWTSAAVMVGLAILLVFWALSPAGDQGIDSTRSHPEIPNLTGDATSILKAEDFQGIGQLNLRRTLHDPPPNAPEASPPPIVHPPLSIRLTGIILEPGHSQALIAMPDGQVELKSVGDDASGAHIISIGNSSITVDYFGQSQVLSVVKENGT